MLVTQMGKPQFVCVCALLCVCVCVCASFPSWLKEKNSQGESISVAPCSRTFLMKQRLSSLGALIFMTNGNFDTEKVSVTFSRAFFHFSRKLQSGNDLINAWFPRQVVWGPVTLRLGYLSHTDSDWEREIETEGERERGSGISER